MLIVKATNCIFRSKNEMEFPIDNLFWPKGKESNTAKTHSLILYKQKGTLDDRAFFFWNWYLRRLVIYIHKYGSEINIFKISVWLLINYALTNWKSNCLIHKSSIFYCKVLKLNNYESFFLGHTVWNEFCKLRWL